MNYPQAYPANLRCSWDITVDEGLFIKLYITDLAVVGEAGQCGDDKIIVSDTQQSLGETLLLLHLVFVRHEPVYNNTKYCDNEHKLI